MINIIQTTKQKIDQSIYGYVEGEFLPIREGDKVINWNAFALYKAKKLSLSIGRTVKAAAVSIQELQQVNHA
jgi:hypothetical protein